MSRRKVRQLERMSPVDRVCLEVRKLSERPFVISVEDHFAGYFDELGLSISVSDAYKDVDVIGLRNDLLGYLERMLPKGQAPFTWQVAFLCREKTIHVLFPWDKPMNPDGPLPPCD